MTTFWVLAPIMVLAAAGMVLVRKAVHAAMLLAVVMISLAVLYALQGAPFLFAVQIIVYTGAIMMLFLFVLMLVGVDSSDSLVETIKGQRLIAAVVGILFGVTTVVVIAQGSVGAIVGLDEANANGNAYGLADLLFSRYVFAFELTSALLITAILGAMVLAHRERLTPKPTQRELVDRRMQAFAETGKHPGPLPTPGVYARHNAVDTPALLPDGTPSALSISQVLRARGTVRREYSDDIDETLRQLDLADFKGAESQEHSGVFGVESGYGGADEPARPHIEGAGEHGADEPGADQADDDESGAGDRGTDGTDEA